MGEMEQIPIGSGEEIDRDQKLNQHMHVLVFRLADGTEQSSYFCVFDRFAEIITLSFMAFLLA